MTLWHGNSLSHASGAWMVEVGAGGQGIRRADRDTLETLDRNQAVTLCFLSSVQGRQGIQGKNGDFGISQPDGAANAKKSFAFRGGHPGHYGKLLRSLTKYCPGRRRCPGRTGWTGEGQGYSASSTQSAGPPSQVTAKPVALVKASLARPISPK